MRKAKVLEVVKYDIHPSNPQKKNRIVLRVRFQLNNYYLDVTDELERNGVDYNYDIEKLKKTVPDYVYASFFENTFRISSRCMERWMQNLKKEQ